ncbi:head-tail adaptor [Palleronia salina]|uniref:Head-tail adaptor n=1 Tax=Palleronia salina TaxID=313368 RepID=A0A1M6AE97_9RHOB|nr:head-tail adaptor protein [Palleronia salina]SHI34876.1 head-tail adaptor [Palleronia salina]
MGGVILDRRLTLEAPETTADGRGGYARNWVALGDLFARVAPRTGRLAAGVELSLSRVGYRITVRAAPQGAASRPLAGQRLRDGTRVFDIRAVTESRDGPLYLDIFADEEVAP